MPVFDIHDDIFRDISSLEVYTQSPIPEDTIKAVFCQPPIRNECQEWFATYIPSVLSYP